MIKNVTKCSYADRYKAVRPPKCGCFVCETKWEIAELKRALTAISNELTKTKNAANSASGAADAALYVTNYCR